MWFGTDSGVNMFRCVLSVFNLQLLVSCLSMSHTHRHTHAHCDILRPHKHKTTTFQSQGAAGFFCRSYHCLFSLISMKFYASEFLGVLATDPEEKDKRSGLTQVEMEALCKCQSRRHENIASICGLFSLSL